ncbi:MAG: ABC transporter permease [Clostridiales bacterium]|nr:ABC transporter permease [Clostridiales bacterium]
MLFLENIKLALTAIRANKMRSFLTMLGIIIGISSVITITSIGASAQAMINKQFETLEGGYMVLMLNWRNTESIDYYADLFSWDDVEALKNRFPGYIRYIELMNLGNNSSTTKVGRTEATLTLYGAGADYNKFDKSIQIIHGRMINQSDVDAARENIVIDVKAARQLFNKENAVGATLPTAFYGEEKDLTVVGVYETPPSIFSGLMVETSYTCYVPISLLLGSDGRSAYIEIFASEKDDPIVQAEAFLSYITKVKNKPDDFYMYQSADEQISQVNTVLGTLSIALGAIAAISLLVGGIGIMNIMLVSVTERTREIGIRKSLGARTKDILTQFLIEAMILSSIGGIIGMALGMSLAGLGMSAFGIGVVIQPIVIVVTVIFSAGVGMFFGIFPARKAARLDPIEALRYE